MKKDVLRLFDEIATIKEALSQELIEISQNTRNSEVYKEELRRAAREKATAALADIQNKSDSIIESIRITAKNHAAFDYSNEKLLAAIKFTEANGKSLPEKAWKQMIADFGDKPQELLFLSTLFGKHGIIDGAIEAKEAARVELVADSLPQRLSDTIYFVCTADPEAHTDFSGILSEINNIQEDEQEDG